MINVGDTINLDNIEYVIKEIKGDNVLLVKRDDALNIKVMNEKTLYAKLYEQQKQRADELQKQLNEKSEGNKSLLNRIDELTTVIEELHISNSGFCEQTELSKLRADRADKRWSELKDFLLRYEDVPQSAQSFETVFEYMKEVERLEEDGD